MNRLLVIIYIFLQIMLFSSKSICQIETKKNHQLGILMGIAKNHLKDKQASPLVYMGSYLPIQIMYAFHDQNSIHLIKINYTNHNLESPVEHQTHVKSFKAQYGFRKQVYYLFDEKINLYIGGKIDYNYTGREYHYSDIIYAESYTNHFSSLYFTMYLKHHITNKTKLGYTFSIPFLTYMIHPGYSYNLPEHIVTKQDHSNWEYIKSGKVTSLHHFKSIEMKICLYKTISDSIIMTYDMYFIYYQFPFPRMIKYETTRFSLGLHWLI